jgi:hypothetical protein
MIADEKRADLLYPDARGAARCYVCKELLFGRVHRGGVWPDWGNPPDAIVFSPPVWRPHWIGLHYPTCEQAFVELVQTPPYREEVRKFLQRRRSVQ